MANDPDQAKSERVAPTLMPACDSEHAGNIRFLANDGDGHYSPSSRHPRAR